MSNVFEFVAESRGQSGKNAARRVRRTGSVPAVIYGGHAEPQMLVLSHNEVIKHLAHEAVYSHVLDIKVDGKTEKAILKGVQRHPAKFQILHMDFLRVNMSELVKVHVPLHFINEQASVGGKKGGIVTHGMIDVEVSCLPTDLPDYIEVDLSGLDVGESVHLSDIKLPARVEIVALAQGSEHDHPVASMMASKASKDDAAA
ncbi:MAG: 50S ribosomal protein L25/general stress protein Ctc [Methylobacter tundripaludum]|uniref:Large ribosomal subunit protein bL25 n=1 Tax=Methylobacter tundripaludum TaxID=173365 RepID=A0A2S6H5P7_9GAMM|nr:50S ribosomal protein L25/general stress protein Ctc [Methylobacter tundripaludum]MCF7965143.1 50S ribosomal protein L25/general stress protein Ctc [Methylobacter tundripaludum]MDD2662075.1 50S ribosomal protein L25/general stress protein Ctc [Methylococcales bacterium]PPK72750.1 LSU ribosomal protein L25P [Methylobacter tundripaludum]